MLTRVLGLIIFFTGGAAARPSPAAPPEVAPQPRVADGPEVKVAKAARDAEVHAVGVYEPSAYRLGDVTDWPKLVGLLRERKGPAGRVYDLLGEDARKIVDDERAAGVLGAGTPEALSLQSTVIADLRKQLDNPQLYSGEVHGNVRLGKDVGDYIALGARRTASQTSRLNWAVLDATFPGCLPALPARFRTVRVDVLAGRDVVLVLSSGERCRWEVTLRDGARVTGVVLCGYHAQEVTGVAAPVVYRAYYGPDGFSLAHPDGYLRAADPKETEKYDRFVAGVKKLVGKGPDSYQWEYRPGPDSEPYAVRPAAK